MTNYEVVNFLREVINKPYLEVEDEKVEEKLQELLDYIPKDSLIGKVLDGILQSICHYGFSNHDYNTILLVIYSLEHRL